MLSKIKKKIYQILKNKLIKRKKNIVKIALKKLKISLNLKTIFFVQINVCLCINMIFFKIAQDVDNFLKKLKEFYIKIYGFVENTAHFLKKKTTKKLNDCIQFKGFSILLNRLFNSIFYFYSQI